MGTGGTDGVDNDGVQLLDARQVTNTGSGTVTVTGTGGATSGGHDEGVILGHGGGNLCTISSSGGNVNVTGMGGGSGTSVGNIGVEIDTAAGDGWRDRHGHRHGHRRRNIGWLRLRSP